MANRPKAPVSLSETAHGKKKCDLEIEYDEDDRDQVVTDVESHARILERLEAAFVGR
jgi:hypothetical protein